MTLRARNPRAAMTTVIGEGFLGRLTFGMVSFALPLYALHLGLSLGEIGILVSIRTVIALGLKPVAGWASDRVGVRTVYLAGTFARVLAAAALFFADSLLMLIAASAYMVHGLFPILATEYAGLSTAQAGLRPRPLWQTGGVFVLFGVRIAIAIIAEISAIAVFGELQNYRPRSES